MVAQRGHRVRRDRTTDMDHVLGADDLGKVWRGLPDGRLGRAVEHEPEGAVLGVLDHQHHRAAKPVRHARRGDQELPGDALCHGRKPGRSVRVRRIYRWCARTSQGVRTAIAREVGMTAPALMAALNKQVAWYMARKVDAEGDEAVRADLG